MPPALPPLVPLSPYPRLIAGEEAVTCLAHGDLVTSLSISSEDHSAGSFLFQKSELAAYSHSRDCTPAPAASIKSPRRVSPGFCSMVLS